MGHLAANWRALESVEFLRFVKKGTSPWNEQFGDVHIKVLKYLFMKNPSIYKKLMQIQKNSKHCNNFSRHAQMCSPFIIFKCLKTDCKCF